MPMSDAALKHFGLSPDDLIGEGGESRVYSLDSERVLRLCRGDAGEYAGRRRVFYDRLRDCAPPFEVACVLDHGSIDGRSYTIEKRMKGQDFAKALYSLQGSDREKALTSYLHVAEQLGEIRFPDESFGEAISDEIRSDTWPSFLRERIEETLRSTQTIIAEDVPRFADVEEYFLSELHRFDGVDAKSLVHGDYCPGNVFMDDDFTICGVGDFSYLTFIGDPRMDLAGAFIFLEVTESSRPGDFALLRRLLTQRHGEAIMETVDFYRLYYSLFFSRVKSRDRPLYDWCVRNLRSVIDGDRH